MAKRQFAVGLALVLLGGALGCGGSGDDSSSGPGGGPNDPHGLPDNGAGSGGSPGDPPNEETTGDTTPCDGSFAPEIPGEYPALGAGCRSRFQYRWSLGLNGTSGEADEKNTSRGVRQMPDDIFPSRYDLGVYTGIEGWVPVALYVPSLEPGLYRDRDGVAASTGLTFAAEYSTWTSVTTQWFSGMLIEIAGRSDGAVWGRFLAHMCLDDSIKNCYDFEAGRFSAAIDDVPSSYEFGQPSDRLPPNAWSALCEVPSDCNTLACGPNWSCDTSGHCSYEDESDSLCPKEDGLYCDIWEGCKSFDN